MRTEKYRIQYWQAVRTVHQDGLDDAKSQRIGQPQRLSNLGIRA